MREIEFRGLSQSLKNEPSEWVYGSLDISIHNRLGYPRIIVHDPELYYGSKYVSMSSIGQFTGLTDKNGVKIFEGDILNVEYNHIGKTEVEFSGGSFNICNYQIKECSVCGNIHEAKENG